MGVLVVSGCTSNGGRALHVAVISDKKKGGLSASFGAQTRTSATGRFCEQATIFLFSPSRRGKCVGKRLTLGNRDPRSGSLLRSVLLRVFAGKNVSQPE